MVLDSSLKISSPIVHTPETGRNVFPITLVSNFIDSLITSVTRWAFFSSLKKQKYVQSETLKNPCYQSGILLIILKTPFDIGLLPQKFGQKSVSLP